MKTQKDSYLITIIKHAFRRFGYTYNPFFKELTLKRQMEVSQRQNLYSNNQHNFVNNLADSNNTI